MRHYEIVFMVHPDQSEQVPGMIEVKAGMDIDSFSTRLSFFFNSHLDFF